MPPISTSPPVKIHQELPKPARRLIHFRREQAAKPAFAGMGGDGHVLLADPSATDARRVAKGSTVYTTVMEKLGSWRATPAK